MNENKKYRLTDESLVLCYGKKLYRIEALKDFGDIRKGEKGGFVESEDNLSQEGIVGLLTMQWCMMTPKLVRML